MKQDVDRLSDISCSGPLHSRLWGITFQSLKIMSGTKTGSDFSIAALLHDHTESWNTPTSDLLFHIVSRGVVHPNMNILSSMFQTWMSFFLLMNTKEDMLKNVGNQTVDGSHWHWQYLLFFSNMEINEFAFLCEL